MSMSWMLGVEVLLQFLRGRCLEGQVRRQCGGWSCRAAQEEGAHSWSYVSFAVCSQLVYAAYFQDLKISAPNICP